jgi:hypothetical protein
MFGFQLSQACLMSCRLTDGAVVSQAVACCLLDCETCEFLQIWGCAESLAGLLQHLELGRQLVVWTAARLHCQLAKSAGTRRPAQKLTISCAMSPN